MLLGIDLGTTGVRAAIFEPGGALVEDASVSCMYESPAVGWAEIPPERWWQATTAALAKLTKVGQVTAIAVVGQAPTAVLVDDDGAALGSAILWLDTRATEEASELGVHAYYLGPKLLWLARNGGAAADSARGRAEAAWGLQEQLTRARWILQSHAYIVLRLTGEAAIDPSTAALAAPMFDLATRTWNGTLVEGVRSEQLPPVRAAHEVVGRVTGAASRASGLPAGAPVVCGGGDFAAATLGAGVLEEGEACLMLGTAGNLLVPRTTPGKDPRLINAHHVGADVWLSLGGTLSGGAQEWFRHAWSRVPSEDTGIRSAVPPFEALDGEAAPLAAGSEGILFLPYLQGERTPIWSTEARGAYVGLGLHHGRGHLWRALLEGVALGFVDCQAVMEDEGIRLRTVVAANGGGKSALFRQILCDALGVPLSYTPTGGGTVAGAAILAGLGTGALALSDVRGWRGSSIQHEPDMNAHARYRELLTLRRAAYEGLKGVYGGLAKLT